MAQYARPSVDKNNPGSWVNQADSGTNIYQTIDETVADDADYIKSPVAPSSAAYVTTLSTVEDPQSSSGHVVRYRYGKDVAGGATVNVTVELRQGYVSEVSQGTLIHQEVHNSIADGWTAGTFTLSSGEADSITDYASLYLRIVATQV